MASPRRDAVVVAALFAVLLVLALLVRAGTQDDDARDPRISSFHSGPWGARALRLVLEELGTSTSERLAPFTSPPDGEVAAAVILNPVEPLTPREVSVLLDWVRGGGTLVYGVSGGRASSPLADSLGIRLRPLLGDSVGAFAVPSWGGATARPTADSLAAGVRTVPGFRTAFEPRSRSLAAGAAQVLAETPAGEATVAVFPLGSGRVIAWSDAAALTNRMLRDGDAALLFVRAVAGAAAAGETVEFDEYHQGYRAGGGPWAALRIFVGTGPGRATLQAAAAALAFLLLVAHRFGSPVPPPRARRRSPVEHVDALATAYRRAGARRTARRLVLEGLSRRLGLRAAVAGNGVVVLPPAIEKLDAGVRLEELLAQGDAVDLASLARAVDDVVMEVRRWT